MIVQRFNLNLIPNQSPVIVHVNQYDTGTGRLIATLYEGNEPYSPSGTAVIQGTKPDGHGFQYTATLDGNVVTADLTEQMAPVAGDVRTQIVVTESSGVTGTFAFIIRVQPSALPSDTDMSESDYQYIEEAIREAQEAVQTAQEATETAQEAVERAQEAITETQENAEDSEAWAQGTRGGIPVEPTDLTYEHNAEYWAQYAERYAQGGLHYKASIPFADIPTTGMREGDMYDITDDFTTDSRFTEGAGIEVKGGTNIAWNSDNKWDILALPYIPKTTFNGRSGSILPMAGDYDSKKILLSSALHIGGETQSDVQEALEALSDDGVKSFNGRSGSVLPMAGDYSAEQVNYDSNQTVKQKIDALVTKESSDIAGQQSLLKDTVGWTGKNLLKNTYPSQIVNGVTITHNEDESLSFSGTATAQIVVIIKRRINTLKTGQKYILSGITGGSNSSYFMTYNSGTTDPYYINLYDGEDEFIAVNESDYPQTYVGLYIRSGQNMTGITIKPMIRKADITDPTYEPYHESVEVMYEEEIHGINLAKNIGTQTLYGVTFTVNADGTVTANGTALANSDSNYDLDLSEDLDGDFYFYGCPSGGGNSTYDVYLWDYTANARPKKWDGTTTSLSDFGAYQQQQVKLVKGHNIKLKLRVFKGQTVSNIVFKPMLRKADIEDSTYRPYNPQAIQNQLNAQGVLGAKNLIPYPYSVGTTTNNGITFTVNSDGTVVANGTSTAFASIGIRSRVSSPLKLPTGRYTISGGVSSNQRIAVGRTYNGAWQELAISSGNEASFNVSESDDIGISIEVTGAGITVNNAVFKPMLRLASDPDDTYQPYAMTNRELTDTKVGKAKTATDAKTTVFSESSKVSSCTAVLNDILCALRITSTAQASVSGAWTTIATLNDAYKPANLVYEAAIDDTGVPIGWARIHATGKVEVYQSSGSAKTVNISSLYLRA